VQIQQSSRSLVIAAGFLQRVANERFLDSFATSLPVRLNVSSLLYGGSQRLRFGSIDVLPLGETLKDCLALISPS
jgi:hypothetical protein